MLGLWKSKKFAYVFYLFLVSISLFFPHSSYSVDTGPKYSYTTQWSISRPHVLAVDAGGYVYSVDNDNVAVSKYTSDGTLVSSFGASGGNDGQFDYVGGIAFDTSGNIYLSDGLNTRVQKFNPAGVFLAKWGAPGTQNGYFDNMQGIAVDSSGVYVSDRNNSRIQKFDFNGGWLSKWGSEGSENGQFYNNEAMAADTFGNVYVTDVGNARIQRFTTTGVFLNSFGSGGSSEGQFSFAEGVAVDNFGNVYVADSENDRVQKFSRTGKFITMLGSTGSQNGQMSNPQAVTVDSERNVYVADNYNDRIQKFAPTRFTDVSDPQWDWARGYIEVLWQTNLTQGYGSTSVFAPGVNVTRDQMAAFIIRAKEGEPGAYYCASGSPFSDVSPDNWACPYIKRLKELGLTTGYGGNPSIYEPLIIVSRDQMAAFLIRSVEGEPDPNHCASGSPFNDVSPDSWVCPYAKRLKELGLTNGYGSPTIYAPSVQVNRAQMAAFLTRAFIGMQ